MYRQYIEENAEKFADLHKLEARSELIERKIQKRWEDKKKRIDKWRAILNEERAQL